MSRLDNPSRHEGPTSTAGPRPGALARDSGLAMLASWSSYLIGAVGGLVLARALQPEGKGLYSLLFLGGILAGAVVTLGTDLWSTKETSRQGLTIEIGGLVRRQLQVITGLGVGGAMVATVAYLVLAGGLPPAEAFALILLAVSSGWSVSLAALLRGARRMSALLRMQLVSAVVFVVGIAAWAALSEVTVIGALYVAIFARLVSIALGPWRLILASRPTEASVWFSIVRSHASSSLGVLVEFASYRVDVLFVALFLTTTEVGLYSVALPLSELLWLLPNALAQVLLPHVAASGAKGASATATAVRLAVGFSIAAAVVLVAASSWLISLLYGDVYRPAAAALPLLSLGAVILTTWKLVTTDLLARGDSSIRARGGVLALVVLVLSLPVLTNLFGLPGAAGASALAYSAAALHGLTRWRTLPGAHLRDLIPGRKADFVLLADITRRGGRALASSARSATERSEEFSE